MFSRGQTVLVVDDLPEVRVPVVIILKRLGFSVRHVADGFSALLEMRAQRPEILIADLQMPGMSGFELLSVVRRLHAETMVIAMSDMVLERSMKSAIPADAFHPKTMGPKHLIELVQRFAERNASCLGRHCVPIWVAGDMQTVRGVGGMVIQCPECLRITFTPLEGDFFPFRKAVCLYCANLIPYALACRAARLTSQPDSQQAPKVGSTLPLGTVLQ